MMAEVLAQLERPEVRMKLAGEALARIYAPSVADGTRPYSAAVAEIAGRLFGIQRAALPLDPVHRLPIGTGREPDPEEVAEWVGTKLDEAASAYTRHGAQALRRPAPRVVLPRKN